MTTRFRGKFTSIAVWSLRAMLAILNLSDAHADESTLLGVQLGPGCTGAGHLAAFSRWLGSEPAVVLDFLDDKTWKGVTDVGWWTHCWAKTGRKVAFSVPMLPKSPGTSLSLGASGEYDDYFKDLGTALVSGGFPDAIVRPGWEFNAEWFAWAAAKDPQSWIAYWRRIVTVMRSVPGARFQFDWCPNIGTRRIDPESVYPGDDYVDIVGMDVYNASATKRNPVDRWNELVDMPNGLKWQSAFADRHGKPISFPEWGTGTNSSNTGGGDDAYFVSHMADWIRQHRVVYQIYWDDTAGYNGKLSDGHQPNAAAAYRAAFSAGTRSKPPTDLRVLKERGL